IISRLERAVLTTQAQLDALPHADDADMLDLLASRVTGLVHRAAFSSFPITGSAPFQSRDVLRLQQQRRDITRLLHIAAAVLQAEVSAGECPRGDCLVR